MKRNMRRFRQQLSEQESIEILRSGKVAVMAVEGDDDYPYAVPINYVYAEGSVYFHSASEGHKIDALKRNPKCSLCVVEKDEIIAEEFTSYFRSVIAFGRAEFIDDEEGKLAALKLMCAKYSEGFDPSKEIQKCLTRVAIIRVRLDNISGKEAIELVRKRDSI